MSSSRVLRRHDDGNDAPHAGIAQFAQRVAQRKRRGAAASDGFGSHRHEAASATCPSIRPERSRTTRSQRCASATVMGDEHQRHAALGMFGEE